MEYRNESQGYYGNLKSSVKFVTNHGHEPEFFLDSWPDWCFLDDAVQKESKRVKESIDAAWDRRILQNCLSDV